MLRNENSIEIHRFHILVNGVLPPPPIFAQQLSITPAAVTILEGDSESFTVVLSSEPTGDVTVAIVRQGGTEVSLDKSQLTFSPVNWNVPQRVRLTAAEDEDSVDHDGALILIASGDGLSGGGITVGPETAIIDSPGQTAQLTATVQGQDGETVSGVAMEWSSADPSIATVDSEGRVIAINSGQTTITAALATASGSATVLIDDPDNSFISDRQILEILFKATGGDGWKDRYNWLTDAPISAWHGVETNADGDVIALLLYENNLRGIIPASLGKLQNLQELVLSSNELTGPIPPELADLSKLKILDLSSNQLTGGIPPELGHLPQLETLIFDGNPLAGPIPSELGNLVRLKEMNLRECSLMGAIPSELGRLSQLEELNLSSNSLTGSIPPELSNLSRLKYLVLTFNSLTGSIPPELGNLTQLEEILVFNNELTGSIPPELGKLTQLNALILATNNLTGAIPSELGNLTQLKEFHAPWNSLIGPIPPELGNLAQLEVLVLRNNELTGSIPPELGNLSQLEELDLNQNQLSGIIPPEFGNLTQLKLLWLFKNELTGPIPSEFAHLTPLKVMDLGDNSLTGTIPSELGNLSQLEELNLEKNQLSGIIPPDLGNLTQLEHLILNTNSLTGPIPSEFTHLTQLKTMNLGDNSLTGTIPPELGKMTALEDFNLRNNQLSGSILPEFGSLPSLTILDLGNNNNLEGLLPRSLLELSLSYVDVEGTGICIQQDTPFLEWWSNLSEGYAEECASEQVERLALIELYNKSGGTSWRNTTGWSSSEPPNNWYGVTIENGRVTELSLSSNGLTGQVSGEIGNFTELTVLNLAGNTLTGVLPDEILSLSELTELRVNGNKGLEGVLDDNLIRHLSSLEILHFGETAICASPASTFQEWYAGLNDTSGEICGNPDDVRLNIPVAYLTQSIQTPERSIRLIEGRDALLRVFVTGDPGPAFFQHEVSATIRAGGRTHQVEMTRTGDQLLTVADESHLDNSFNAVIPGDFIMPGATLVVEADPDGVIPRAAGSQDRFPVTGEEQLNIVSVPAMEVIVVPVLEANEPDRSIFEWTDNISDNSPEVGLFKYAFPFREFRARSREAYVTSLDLVSDDGQWGLVLELEALRFLDRGTGYYYGAAASVNGYVRGVARLGGWTSMGKAWDTELAHEIGHNLNLDHAPCGGPDFTDPDYPHAGGSVGVWGFDFRDSTLISPRLHKDIMGYCYDQGWISDYFFEKVIDFRERVEGKNGRPMAGAPLAEDVLVLWGGVQGGVLRMEPPFAATAPAQLPDTDGPYRLEGLGQQDEILFSLSFTPGEDKFGNQYFFFAIPIEQEWEESLDRIVLTGPEQSVTMDTNDPRALSILRDANTGQVRGILRDWDGNLPAALEQTGDFSVTTIQGIKESVRLQR